LSQEKIDQKVIERELENCEEIGPEGGFGGGGCDGDSDAEGHAP
jgi:hypothetical protein